MDNYKSSLIEAVYQLSIVHYQLLIKWFFSLIVK